ncbi:MAG: PAS domain-containing protein [Spirochaetes bacterium]|nr:PAS domain-containing protein [Spirochaetota bacterium]
MNRGIHLPGRALPVSFVLGLSGFIGAHFSFDYAIGSFTVSVNWAYLFPLLAAMAYGPRGALVAGVLGLGAFYPFYLWPTNGWANVASSLLFVAWFAWQGGCAASRETKPAWWNHPFVAQVFYCAAFALMIFGLYPILFSLNPPPWRADAYTSIPASVLNGIVFKEVILTYLAVLVVASLLKSNRLRRLLGLRVPSWARYNDRILAVSILGCGVMVLFHRVLAGILVTRDFPGGLFLPRESGALIDLLILGCIGFLTAYIVTLFMERRCRAEESLEQNRELLGSTLRSMDDLVFTLDALGRITQYHQPAAWIGGVDDARGMVGLEFGRALPAGLCLAMEPILGKILAGGVTEPLEYALQTAKGERRYQAKLSPLRGSPVAAGGVTVVARDVTEQKKMEERLRHTQKMEAVGRLAGGIAHDFNNLLAPIGVLAGVAEIHARDPVKLAETLERIKKAAARARELTQQILSFGRKSPENAAPVALAPVVKECLKLLRASMPTNVEVHVDLRSQAKVLGDSVQLYQVVMNLCTNAFQAMEERGGVLSVSLADGPTEGGAPSVVLEFRDTGCGIPDEVKSRIFEPYFTTKETGKGSGLGLSVVHGIVAGMRGSIQCESLVGQGTSFLITLPAC